MPAAGLDSAYDNEKFGQGVHGACLEKTVWNLWPNLKSSSPRGEICDQAAVIDMQLHLVTRLDHKSKDHHCITGDQTKLWDLAVKHNSAKLPLVSVPGVEKQIQDNSPDSAGSQTRNVLHPS